MRMPVLACQRLGFVVVTRHRNAERAAPLRQQPAVRIGKPLLQLAAAIDRLVEVAFAQAETAHEFAILLDIGELALSRRVVHRGNKADQRIAAVPFEQVRQRRVDQLAAQVQMVLGAQMPACGRLVQHRDGFLEHLLPVAARAMADAQRVEDGGHAGGDRLRVMRHQRRKRRPLDARPRQQVTLQIVGVEFDEAGQQQIAVEILGARQGRGAGVDRGDPPVGGPERARQHFVGQHQPGIGKQKIARHRHPRNDLARIPGRHSVYRAPGATDRRSNGSQSIALGNSPAGGRQDCQAPRDSPLRLPRRQRPLAARRGGGTLAGSAR